MKKLTLAIAIFAGTTATAQNWSLVMPNDTLVYEKQDNNQFFTVWVDSTQVNGTDTTYFMNRISPGEVIGQGDSSDICVEFYKYTNWEPVQIRAKYKSQFCGSSITFDGSKSIVFYEQSQFVIYANNPVGAKWVCDSTGLDTMEVLSAGLVFIDLFQEQDSIKVFEFKGQNFTLSKTHGIISNFALNNVNGMSYDLMGVQNLGVGDLIPMYEDIFDFYVGDVFVRLYSNYDHEGTYKSVSKHEIISKTIINDTLMYNTNSAGVLKYWKGMNPILDAYPNTIANCKPYYFSRDYFALTPKSQVLVIRNDSGQIQKMSFNPENWNYYGYCDTTMLVVEFESYGPIAIYQSGLEPILEGFGGFDLQVQNSLIGYIKDGVPHGDTTSISEIEFSNLIKIYPNPTNNIININTEKINGITVLEMYDLRGQLITTNTFESKITLDVSQWSNGVYFAIIKDADGAVLHREKIIIQ